MRHGSPRILIAGIGNIFQGDDAFGVEVTRRLAAQPLRTGVVVRDFGIRGIDLAFGMNDDWDLVILIDAIARQEAPGTVFVIEPDRNDLEACFAQDQIQPHGMHPLEALRLAQSLGNLPGRILLVGCEPGELGGDDGVMGLSPPVEASLDAAVATIERLLAYASAPAEYSGAER